VSLAYQQDWPSIFGPGIAGSDVEGWTLALLRRWFSTYLAEVERQHSLVAGELPRPKGWALGPSFDKWPEDQVPGVLVGSTGIVQTPQRGGDGGYSVRFQIDVGVVCSARTQAESHQLAMLYGLAVRWLVIQRPNLDAGAQGVDWLGESYTDLGYDDTRSLYASRDLFAVQVDNVTYGNAGPTAPDAPLTPDTDPWADWPTVETVEVEVDRQPDPEE
jgi:hypothetical protein